jgi:hypothetical protein
VGSLVSGIGGVVRILPALVSGISALTSGAALAGLASLLLPGGIILVGLGLIAAAIYQSGAAARQAERDIAGYKTALAGLGPAALPALNASVVAMQSQLNLLKQQRAEIVRTEGEVSTFTNRSDLGTGTTTVKNAKITAIDEQIRRLAPTLDAARAQFNKLLDAELATETGAHGLQNAIGKVVKTGAGLGTIPIDFGAKIGAADAQITSLIGTVGRLVTAYRDVRQPADALPGLAEQLLRAHDAVSVALTRQKDQYSAQALQLQDIKRDLEGIAAVKLAIARQEFGDPKMMGIIPRAQVIDVIPRFETGANGQLKIPALDKITLPIGRVELPQGVVSDFQRAVAAELAATSGLNAAQLFGGEDQIRDAAKRAASASDVLRESMQRLEAAVKSSALPEAQQKQILGDMADAARKAGLQVRGLGENTTKAASKFDVLLTASRGLLNIVSSIKGIDDGLVDITRGAIDATEAFRALSIARKAGDTLGQVGGVLGVVGGLISIGTSIADVLSRDRREREALAKESNEIIKRNSEALDALRVRNEGFTGSVGDLSELLNALKNPIRPPSTTPNVRTAKPRTDPLTNIPTGLGVDPVVRADFDKTLRGFGTSLREVEQFAKQAGITLYNSAGQIIPQAFTDLKEAIALTIDEMIHFQSTLSDQRSLQDLFQDVFDIDQSPVQRLQNNLDLIGKLAPQLSDTFFKGLDSSTAEGRAQIESSLRALVTALRDGTIDIAAFGKLLGKDELAQLLLGADNALDDLADTATKADKALGELVNVPTGFAVARRVYDAITANLDSVAAGALATIPSGTRRMDAVETIRPTATLAPVDVAALTRSIEQLAAAPRQTDQEALTRLLNQVAAQNGTTEAARPIEVTFDFGGVTLEGPIAPETDINELLGRLRTALIAKARAIDTKTVEAFIKIWPA